MSHPLSTSRRAELAQRARAGQPARAFLVRALSRSRGGDRRPGRFSRKRWLRRLEIGLWTAGCLLLTAAIGTQADAALWQWRAGLELAELTAVPETPSEERPARIPLDDGAPLAWLRVPRLGIDAIVAEGVSTAVLARAIGHLPASARPGEAGNIALAAHRDTFFRPLEGIRTGDEILLERPDGVGTYRVAWTKVVAPSDTTVLADTSGDTLTLVTCYPFRWVGPAPERFVVRAERIAGPPTEGRQPA